MTNKDKFSKNILTMHSISKKFAGIEALENVFFDLNKGEVHAIVGANGAGKSTLINILGGVFNDYSGLIRIAGNETRINTPHKSHQLGISLLTQEQNLVRELSISDNIFLGNEPILFKYGCIIDHNSMIEKCELYFKMFGLDVDPKIKVADISPTDCQIVAIIKSLVKNSRIIIFDEPTAALTANETFNLFDNIKKLCDHGIAVVLVSHKLEDIFEISNRVTVLRDGKCVFNAHTETTSRDEILFHMLGKEPVSLGVAKNNKTKKIFSVQNLEGKTLKNVSFDLSEGEAIGIIGKHGAGHEELIRIICGIEKMSSGKIFLNNCTISINTPTKAIDHGIGFLSEDRNRNGLFSLMNIADNITMPYLKNYFRMGLVHGDKIKKITNEQIDKLDIKVSNIEQPVAYLSGGNQQKVILARLLCNKNAKIFILEEPTKGIDAGARSEIYSIIKELLKNGKSCIISSSNFEELIMLSDRLILFEDGIIKKILNSDGVRSVDLLNFVMGHENNA